MPDEEQQPSLEELTELFRELGAQDPEGWAGSQIREGIQQLARFTFLRGAWRGVVADGEIGWIDREVDYYRRRPSEPGAGAGRALVRLLDSGASVEDLAELVRTMQWQTLYNVCLVIDGATDDLANPTRPDEHWHLVLHKDLEVCEFDSSSVGGLHESVLETDPTGREMRPRPEG